ncbi:hypothetical protein BV25DRAFT_1842327 [Artomyces pyxidatus]|uniref:Uncharacterized protein n=1 Tax=Artomyces pyxidatus TaxID=48021 RepID=A0ACB8SJE7_9AGAM|nr:hypothetical protein BV25DRAFT_1842327 [Artomyces pyxidatus]
MSLFSDAELARATRTLHRNPAQALMRAREGSIIDIETISKNADSLPMIQTIDLIEALKVPDLHIPTAPGSPSTLAVDRAVPSLLGLGYLAQTMSPLDMYSRAWRGVLKWLFFFDELYAYPNTCYRKATRNTVALVLHTLVQARFIPASAVTNTPEIVALATSLWLNEHSAPSMTHPVGSSALVSILHASTADALRAEIVRLAGGSVERVAKLAVSRLQLEIESEDPRSQMISVYTDLVCHLSLGQGHTLRDALLHQAGMSIMTKTLLLTSQRTASESFIMDTLAACVSYIRDSIEAGEGVWWVQQALRAGLLQVLRRYYFTSLRMSSLGPRYMVYKSIVGIVHAALTELETRAHQARIARSVFADPWQSLHRLVLDRVALKHTMDNTPKNVGVCSNCDKRISKEDLKKCSRCHAVLCCSRNCQRTDWEQGHNRECALHTRVNENRVKGASKQDRRYNLRLAVSLAERGISQVRALAAFYFPDIPLSKLGVRVDFTKVPLGLGLFPLADYRASDSVEFSDPDTAALEDGIVERVRASNGRITLVEAVASCGRIRHVAKVRVVPSLWEREDRNVRGVPEGRRLIEDVGATGQPTDER